MPGYRCRTPSPGGVISGNDVWGGVVAVLSTQRNHLAPQAPSVVRANGISTAVSVPPSHQPGPAVNDDVGGVST